jgi:hypothetical protein
MGLKRYTKPDGSYGWIDEEITGSVKVEEIQTEPKVKKKKK